ncbi:MAG: thioredoxin [Bacteroidetes bacterium]|nr:thioredoxin [Bacteroidota bacterium]
MSSFQELIQQEKPLLVDFSAQWCGPCKAMSPILNQVKEMLGNSATIIKIDVDANPSAASAYNIQSVPTLLLFKKGKVLWRQSGVVPANHLKDVILQHV